MAHWVCKEVKGVWFPFDTKRQKFFVDWDSDEIFFTTEKECEEWCDFQNRLENAGPF